MQANLRGWTPPVGTLGELTRAAERRAAALAPSREALERSADGAAPAPPFAASLLGRHVAVVAELKRSSPSKGAINAAMRADAQAAAYAAGGAAALSVLTEPERFGGSIADLGAARAGCALPLLRKDFLVDELQLLEARAHGASAVLLIARALSPDRLDVLAAAARAIGVETLVEVRDEWELERALAAGASVVGVNNRDLETLVIHADTAARIVPLVPADRPAVWESGVQTAADVARAADAGADAVLVGSSISAATDPSAAVALLAATARRGRG